MSRCLFIAGGIRCTGTTALTHFCADHEEHRGISQHGKAGEVAMSLLPVVNTLIEVRKVLELKDQKSVTVTADMTSLLEQAQNLHSVALQCEEDGGNTEAIVGIEERFARIESEFIRLMAQLASSKGTTDGRTLRPN